VRWVYLIHDELGRPFYAGSTINIHKRSLDWARTLPGVSFSIVFKSIDHGLARRREQLEIHRLYRSGVCFNTDSVGGPEAWIDYQGLRIVTKMSQDPSTDCY
jgi:hypothetical protein